MRLPLRTSLNAVRRRGRAAWSRYRLSARLKRKVEANLTALRAHAPAEAFAFDLAPARAFLADRFGAYQDTRWHLLYGAASGRPAPEYVPEDLFFAWILPELNPVDRAVTYQDKNLAEALGIVPAPETVARVVRGRWRDVDRSPVDVAVLAERFASLPQAIVKPARGSGGGRSVGRVAGSEVLARVEEVLRANPEGDWVVQVPLRQHPALARLNESSVNTYRVLTLRWDDAVHAIATFVRIGRHGSVVDNVTAGGFGVGVALDGTLDARGYAITGVSATHHPDHGYAFGDARVPPLRAVHDVCRAAHDRIAGVDLIAWDVALDADGGPVLLEANTNWVDIAIHQYCTGPVFGTLADAVLRRRRVPTIGPWLR